MMMACCCAKEGGEIEEVQALPLLPEEAPQKPEASAPATPAEAQEVKAGFTFRLPDDSTKEVIFASKPLGLDFSKSIPLTVKSVKKDSAAESAGIEAKWVLTHVAGDELPSDLKEVMRRILATVRELPTK